MRPLRRPMFRTGGPIKEGVMNGLREGGVATTMADATGYAGGGMAILPPMRGRVTGPGMYSQPPLSQFVLNQTPQVNTGRLNIGVPDQPNLTKMQKAKNIYQKGKGFFKSPTFSERGIKTLAQRKLPQYAKGIARSIGSFAGGAGSRFPIATRLAPYYAMYKASEVTPVDAKYGISRTDNLFAPFKSNTVEIMQKKALRNAEQAANPNNFYRYDPGKYGPRKDHPDYDPKKIRYNPFSKDTGAAETPILRDADGKIIVRKKGETPPPGKSNTGRNLNIQQSGGTKQGDPTEEDKLNRIYKLLGVKRAQANAASKALIDMSRYIDEGGKDTISRKNIGSTISKAIGAFDKRLDKADQLKEAAGLLLAKGEIAEMGDPLGKEAKRLSIKVNKEKLNPGVETMLMAAESNAKGGTVSEAKISEAVRRGALNEGKELIEYISSDDIEDGNLTGSVTEIVEKLENKKPGYYQIGKSVIEVDDSFNITLRSGPAVIS
jgi:hypothetical protein